MPVLTFKDQGGNTIKVNSPDGSVPSETELDQLFKQSYMAKNRSNPSMQGGASSPALAQAKETVSRLEGQSQRVDDAVGFNQAAYNATWPVSLMMKKGLGDKGANPQAVTSSGRLAADIGALKNPILGEALNLGGKALGGVGEFVTKRTNIVNELKGLQKQYGETVQGVKVPIKQLAKTIGDKVQETRGKLSDFKKKIDDSIFKEAEKSASSVRNKVPTFFKNAATEYGNRLDEIASTADETGNITRQEAHDLVNNIKAEATEMQLDIGPVFSKVNKILDKYPLEGEESSILNEKGEKTVVDMSQEKIPFKELNQQIREVMKKTSSAFKAGQRSTPEDVVGMITKEHYGNFLEQKVAPEVSDALKQLNAEYRPIAQARKELGAIFRPHGEFTEGQGASFLAKAAENIAKKDLSEGKVKLLSLLEKGNKLTPGIGDVSSRIKALGDEKVTTEGKLNDLIKDLSEKQNYVEKLQATREAMDKKVGWVLGALGIGGGGVASSAYRAGRNITNFQQE